MKDTILSPKSFDFALRIVNLRKLLCDKKNEYILSKQLLRSGTAIGALVREAEHAQSKADFLSKMNIALKEANETEYWIALLNGANYLTRAEFDSIQSDCSELIRLLASIVKTTKASIKA